jgi:hypothetical protein
VGVAQKAQRDLLGSQGRDWLRGPAAALGWKFQNGFQTAHVDQLEAERACTRIL